MDLSKGAKDMSNTRMTKKLTKAQARALEMINRRKASDLVTETTYTWRRWLGVGKPGADSDGWDPTPAQGTCTIADGSRRTSVVADCSAWGYASTSPTIEALARRGLVALFGKPGAHCWADALPASEAGNLPTGWELFPVPERKVTKRAKAEGYKVGQAVQVHAFGRWYAGEVVKLGRTLVTVRYTTGTGITRDKAVDGSKVRPLTDERGI